MIAVAAGCSGDACTYCPLVVKLVRQLHGFREQLLPFGLADLPECLFVVASQYQIFHVPFLLQVLAGCSKRLSSKAAGSAATEAYLYGTSQGDVRPRTLLAAIFNSLLTASHGSHNKKRLSTRRDGFG